MLVIPWVTYADGRAASGRRPMARDLRGRRGAGASRDRFRPPGGSPPRPRGGITAKLLHSLRIGDALGPFRFWRFDDDALFWGPDDSAPFWGPDDEAPFWGRPAPTRVRPRPGRRQPLSDPRLLEVAYAYAAAWEAGDSRPALAVATKLGIRRGTARWLLNRAKRRGFLTWTHHPGLAGAALTPEARALLPAPTLPPPRKELPSHGHANPAQHPPSGARARAPGRGLRAAQPGRAPSPKKPSRSPAKLTTRANTRGGKGGASRTRTSTATRSRAANSTSAGGRASRRS